MSRQFSISSFLLLLGLVCQSHFLLTSASKVDPSLLRTFEKTETRSTAIIMVEMAGEGTSKVLESIKGRQFRTREERASFTVSRLQAQADLNQRNILDFLNQRNEWSRSLGQPEVEVTPFWITNKICIHNADLNLIKELAKREDVLKIRENIVVPLLEPVDFEMKETNDFSRANPTPSVLAMNGHMAWVEGATGEGVTVALIDTGVYGDHQDLMLSFSGCWYDPMYGTTTPNDDHGHGTHVCGLIAGQGGTGMAPGAKWMACKGCSPDGCFEYALIASAQKVSNPGPEFMLPQIVTNSWGGYDGGVYWYRDCIITWIALKILPIFAAGNSGPSCNSISYPASDPDVVAVAACDDAGYLAYFSSRGPSAGCPEVLKPDVAAPGSSVISTWLNNQYASLSGTSMAAPLVAGLAACYQSLQPSPTINNLESLKPALLGYTEPCHYTNESCFGETHNAPTRKNWWDGDGMLKYASQNPSS